ncbi:MAG: peroxiredoxin [Nocardioidaceae bacterium]
MVDVGAEAPDFTLRDQHGQELILSKFRGEKAVVLMFYPFAFSGVCTGELCEVRDRQSNFDDEDVHLAAISCDPVYSLRAFADRDALFFPLLSDFWPHGAVSKAYGVFDEERGCARRSTFIVDKAGVIRWSVHNAMPEARDLSDQIAILENLRAGR